MYDMIREWPRYVKVPFPLAKVHSQYIRAIGNESFECCRSVTLICSFLVSVALNVGLLTFIENICE